MTLSGNNTNKSGRELAFAGLVFLALTFWCRPLAELSQYTAQPLLDPAGILQVYPWLHYNADQIKSGHLPLWNPYTALGQPHLANIQTAVLFPYYWVWNALGAGEAAYGAMLLLRLWIAAMLWFVFARKKLCSFPGALVAGAAYGFGGYSLWFMQLIDLNSQMLLPLLLLALPELLLRPRLRILIASALLVCLAILGGHPEAAFITVFVAVLYAIAAFLVEAPKGARVPPPALLLAGSGFIGVLLTFGVMIPFLNYLSRCWTMHGPGFGFFHLDPRALFNLIIPGIHVLFTDMPKVIPVEYINLGSMEMMRLPYTETLVPGNLPGAGIVICGLALFAMVKARRLHWPVLFFTGLLAILLGLTLGLPIFRLIALIPPFNMNSNFKFFFSEIHACLAVLAGAGVDAMWKSAKQMKRKGKIILIVLSYIIILFIGGFLTENSYLEREARLLLGSAVIGVGLLIIIIISFIAWAKSYTRTAYGISLTCVFIMLAASSLSIQPFIRIVQPYGKYKSFLISELKEKSKRGERIFVNGRYWPPNLLMLNKTKDIRSSDALFYKPYVDLINKVNGLSAEKSLDYFYPSYFTRPSPERLLMHEAKKLSVGYALSEVRWEPKGIIDQVVLKGEGTYSESPPRRSRIIYFNSLFLHAPAKVSFSPISFSLNSSQDTKEGEISFFPYNRSYKGDGIIFQAQISSNGIKPKIGYSRYFEQVTKKNFIDQFDKQIIINVKKMELIELSTLPGPHNDRNNDWSGFADLSWHPGGYEPPPEPIWAEKARKRFLYGVPHLPWAHVEGEEKSLEVERVAGDEVAIDVSSASGKTLVVHEAWYPGWRVEVDGGPGKIEIPEDKVSWRVQVPEGGERAVFRFVPYDFRIGLFVTLVSALVGLAMFLMPRMDADGHGK